MSDRVPLAALGLLVLGFAGCASHVEWAPDSKSFLYSHQDGRILRYDVGTRSSTLVTRVKAVGDDSWPVFSQRASDGLLVFAESVTVGDGSRRVETTLHYVRADGTPLRTNRLTWVAHEEESSRPEPLPSYVEWSPKGTHVLVTTKSSVALHDFEKGTFTVHEELAPALPLELGASPWRPDGAGVLATKTAESDDDDVYFVTLDGNAHELANTDLDDAADDDSWPVGVWKGTTLVTTFGKVEFHVDTAEREVTQRVLESPPRHRWPVGKAIVELEGKGDGAKIVWSRGRERVVVTNEIGAAFSSPTGPVVPSPDGQRVVVVGENGIVLVGESGIVERIPVAPNGDDGNQ